jgi:hypothetical protein
VFSCPTLERDADGHIVNSYREKPFYRKRCGTLFHPPLGKASLKKDRQALVDCVEEYGSCEDSNRIEVEVAMIQEG